VFTTLYLTTATFLKTLGITPGVTRNYSKERLVIRSRKTTPIFLFALGTILLAAGCSSGGTAVRLMNAMNGQSSVSMLVNSSTVASGTAYGAASGYSPVSSGSQSVQIQAAGVTLFNTNVSFNSGNNTVLATDFGTTVFADNKSTPSAGDIQIRAINAANAMGTADVYIVAPGTDISTVNASATNLGFQAASSYQSLAAGSYQVEFTQAGTKNVLLNSNALSFSAGQIRTVISLDGTGVFTTAVLSDLN
jgi:hypothetical protein